MPELRAVVVMVTAFLAASVGMVVFPVLAHVLGMFAHECGHAIAGWLLGAPSFPLPYLTLHYDRSAWVQAAVLLLLLACSAWLSRRSIARAAAGMGLAAVIAAIAAGGLAEPVMTFMGTGGALLLGGSFLAAGWEPRRFRSPFHHGVVAFAGFSIWFDAMNVCRRLLTDARFREDYSASGASAFGLDNDFQVLSQAFPLLSVQAIAGGTLALGLAVLAASMLRAVVADSVEP